MTTSTQQSAGSVEMATEFLDEYKSFHSNPDKLLEELKKERDALVAAGATILAGDRASAAGLITARMPYRISVGGALQLGYEPSVIAEVLHEQGWGDVADIENRIISLAQP